MVKPNIIDRAVGFLAPKAGAKRFASRLAMEQLREYAGADRGRLRKGWNARSTSADTEIGSAGRLLRDRMRDLVRNNALAANAVEVLVTHAIGDGIVPKFKSKKTQRAFDRWVKQCDVTGEQNFYALQALGAREVFEAGEVLFREIATPFVSGSVPLRLQLLEADHIDSSKQSLVSGNVIQGIEVNEDGAKTAFYLFDKHPGGPQSSISGHRSTRHDAAGIVHVLVKERTQMRGVPWGASVITDLHDLDGYKEAERVRKRIEACLVAVLVGESEDAIGVQSQPQERGFYDAAGNAVSKLAPGMLLKGVGGTDVKFLQPTANGGYGDYTVAEEHWVAAGYKIPHFVLTGRLDKVNYSSSKVGLEVFKRMISRLQWHTFIPGMCEPLMQWWLRYAYLAGVIDSQEQEYDWVPPRFYSADPMKDLKAQKEEIRSGLKPWQDVIVERGENPDDVAERIAADNQRFDDKKIVVDVDPRQVSAAGQLQKDQTRPDDDDDIDDDTVDDDAEDEQKS